MRAGGGFARWRIAVVGELARRKRQGLTFEAAWRLAMEAHPPRRMDIGPDMPTLEDEVPVLEFFRQACADAWAGRHVELEDLPHALEGGLTRNWPTVGGRGVFKR